MRRDFDIDRIGLEERCDLCVKDEVFIEVKEGERE